jgi:MFS transporter, ACS family, tartrate transporter
MNEDLGFTPEVFGFGAGIFFAGYILFEVPSNLALARFGARIWIARIMISWGLVATAMAFVTGETSFYALRFLLGVAEAGFFPGIILYLTYWFPREERARIVSLFMTAVPIATVVGGPLSGALLGLHGLGGIAGWRWLFIIEGIPAVLLGIVALRFLTDRPKDAPWLAAEERSALEMRIQAEAEDTRVCGYAGIGQALTNPRVIELGLLYFCLVVGLYGVGFWMPQVLKTFGLSNLAIGFPHRGALSDRRYRHGHRRAPFRRHRRAYLARGTAAVRVRSGLRLVGPCRAASTCHVGLVARHARYLCRHRDVLVAAVLDPDRHRRCGGARLINSIGNCGGFAGPVIVGQLKGATGDFTAALLFLAGALALAGSLALHFGMSERRKLRRTTGAI